MRAKLLESQICFSLQISLNKPMCSQFKKYVFILSIKSLAMKAQQRLFIHWFEPCLGSRTVSSCGLLDENIGMF